MAAAFPRYSSSVVAFQLGIFLLLSSLTVGDDVSRAAPGNESAACGNDFRLISGSIALVVRGDCNFSLKAEIAQAGGAAGLIVINDDEGLMQMGCGNDTNLNITIPVIIISKSGGEELKKSIATGEKGNTPL